MFVTVTYGTVIGLLTGTLFFGGLWWSLQRLEDRPAAAGWFALGAFVRAGLALAGFWVALQYGLAAVAAAMVAFLVVRFGAVRLAKPSSKPLRRVE